MTDWLDVPVVYTGDWIDAAFINQYWGDNFRALQQGYAHAGSMAYAIDGNTIGELAIGATGKVLSVVAGAPAWAFHEAFKVGDIHISTVATNPATTLGYGTWEAFGAGRVMVGLDAGQTEFDTAEETGGAKTHALSVAELASHYHTMDVCSDLVHVATGSGAWTPGTTPRNTGTAGSGTAHNNLQPYIVVYFWKRTG